MTQRYYWENTETGEKDYASPVEMHKKYKLCKPCMKALAKGFSKKKHYKNWIVTGKGTEKQLQKYLVFLTTFLHNLFIVIIENMQADSCFSDKL